jgi:hypothetical protein
MCTVTWRREGSRFEVFFNRDELQTRPPARPPIVAFAAPYRYVAPIDGGAGGSWLAVNEKGLVVGILNFYDGQAAPPPARPRSRGQLVLDQMAHASVEYLRRAFRTADLAAYPSFILVALDPAASALFHWDGRWLREDSPAEPHRPLTTSSFDTAAVVAARRARYAALVGAGEPDAASLERFHRDRDPRGDAYSVWMEREDARTVSFSRVLVDDRAVVFCYREREGTVEHRAELPRSS